MSDDLRPAENMRIERHIYFHSDSADISHLTTLPVERLQTMRGESAAAEQAIFENLQVAALAWETQAEQTLSLDKAIEYTRTPPVKHTANQWEKSDVNNERQNMSNMVYAMSYYVYERTRYDKAAEKSVPVAWELSWSVRTNTPERNYSDRVAGQSKKVYSDKAEMEKYLAGRIKAYSHLFTEISPPIPQEYVKNFRVNGQLLPGYTVEGEEPKPLARAAVIENGGDSVETNNTEQRKERENMNEPLNIQLLTREMYEKGDTGGAWLKLPTTAEQLNAALARIGAQGGDFIINGIETPVPAVARIPLENVQKAGLDELNYLAVALQSRDDKQIAKLNAATEIMADSDDIHRLAELMQNTGVYDFHPDIFNNIQLGEYTLKHSPFIQIPDELAAAVDVEKLGQLAAEHEKGIFTEHGYIVPNGEEWKPVTEIPQEYRITPKFETPEIDFDAIATRKPAVAVAAAPFVLVADNPRDKLKEITEKLEAGIKGIFDSEQYKTYLKTLSKFHNYSFNNCLLIAMQKPDASHVAGFNAWRDDFKRPVMKGEKGIKILAPAPFKTKKQVDAVDAHGKPIYKDGKRVKEEKEITVPAFKVTTVFDVSQTDGEPLPQLGVNELAGSVDKYKDFFAALEKTSLVPIGFEAIKGGAKGYYHLEEKRIAINEGMSELQNLKTVIHEIAHSRLHDIDKNAPKDTPRPDRRTREVEAESIAYTVCQHYGLDTSDYSFGYVATWSGGKELDVLKASLDTIRKEADAIITEIDKHFAEITQSKEQTATQGLEQEVKATLQFFIDEDMKNHGALSAGTLEAIAVQGYEYRDGKLEQAAPAPERQPGHEKWSEPATKENAPDNPGVPSDNVKAYLPEQGDTFTIYQLKDGDQTRDLRFEPLARLEAAGLAVALANYDKIYSATLENGATLEKLYFTFNMDRPEDFKGHSLSISDVVVMNRDGKETAFYVDGGGKGFQELPGFLTPKEQAQEKPVDLKAVADYMQKLNDGLQAVKPDSSMSVGAYNAVVKRLEQANGRIPDSQPQLKALITNAAQSPDFNTLKERMNTLHTEFTQHYSTAVQMTIDTSGKAQPPAPAVSSQQREPAPAQNPPAHGENVAAIEARVKAGEVINLTDLSDAIKKDKQAAQTGQHGKAAPQTGQSRTYSRGKAASKQTEKPSIRDEIEAGKKQLAGQKSAPSRAQNKNAGLGE